MQERKLRVGFVRFPYGGNGGTSQEVPDIADWLIGVIARGKSDPRIEDIVYERFSDTPVTMVRNAAVYWAKQAQVDVLVMIDSDMSPDLYFGKDPAAKRFFESSFDFLYENFEKQISVIVAPYCGPPPHPMNGGQELVYVFRWTSNETQDRKWPVRLEAVPRMEAAKMTGIVNCDTGPTGLCMIDMRVFEHLSHPYFDYEWDGESQQCRSCHQTLPGERRQKASTEDCYFFRNIALNCCHKLGYNPVFCNWDAWAGHWKPKCVGKPEIITSDMVGRQLTEAVLSGVRSDSRIVKIEKGVGVVNGAQSGGGQLVTAIPAPQPQPGLSHEQCQQLAIGLQGDMPKHGDEWIYGTDVPEPEDLGHKTPADTLRALSTLVERYCWAMPDKSKKIVIVELGAWVGRSARAICAGVPEGFDYEVHSIDQFAVPDPEKKSGWATLPMWEAATKRQLEKNDPDPILSQYKENLTAANVLGKRVFYHRNTTADAAKVWPDDKQIDILFIDGDHSYAGVKDDINNWIDFTADSYLIIGDDWNNHDVQRATLAAFGRNLKKMCNLWYVDYQGGNGGLGD